MLIHKPTKPCIALLIHGFVPIKTWLLIACDTAFYAIISISYLRSILKNDIQEVMVMHAWNTFFSYKASLLWHNGLEFCSFQKLISFLLQKPAWWNVMDKDILQNIQTQYFQNHVNQMWRIKRICVFEHSIITNCNCACPAIQRIQGSGFLSEGSSWITACMSEQRRFWWDCADAQARLNLRCSHRR